MKHYSMLLIGCNTLFKIKWNNLNKRNIYLMITVLCLTGEQEDDVLVLPTFLWTADSVGNGLCTSGWNVCPFNTFRHLILNMISVPVHLSICLPKTFDYYFTWIWSLNYMYTALTMKLSMIYQIQLNLVYSKYRTVYYIYQI